MKKGIKIAMTYLALVALAGTISAQSIKVYVVDKNITYQEIDNFSASDAWRCHFVIFGRNSN